MTNQQLQLIESLRHALHQCPEISGQEVRTKALLQQFLREHTTLELQPCGEGFYAAHREQATEKPAIALRADYDALATPDGGAAHLCGHDGHAASLCAVALALEGRTLHRNVFLLFQPSEETGAGAYPCCELFKKEQIGEIYGAHNLPGFPAGAVYTRPGTFACASRGVTLRFSGAPTHAAYPENGRNPALAVGKLLCALPELASPAHFTGMTLCTVIGAELGEKAFGAACAQAEIWLTLRAELNTDLDALRTAVLGCAKALAQEAELTFFYEEQDVFPATENDEACAKKVLALCHGSTLEVPMRWSEDFGHYLLRCPGAFFGIGAGEQHAPLHTADYEYPDSLLAPTAEAFLALMEGA